MDKGIDYYKKKENGTELIKALRQQNKDKALSKTTSLCKIRKYWSLVHPQKQ